MKVAVSSNQSNIQAGMAPVFGRCAYFVIVDTDTMEWEALANEARAAGGGAGIQAAQFVASQGVQAVISGQVGPNAFQTLAAAGIKVFSGASGSVEQTVRDFQAGKLNEVSGPSVPGHHGMGGGGGAGRGRRW